MKRPGILTIDDDPEFNALLRLTLDRIEVETTITDNCEKFLKELRKKPPNLCIVDINLEQGFGAGYQLLKAIRKNSKKIHLLVLSRRSSREDILTALGNGADDFLPKPLDDLLLLTKIEKRLGLAPTTKGVVYKKVPDTNSKALLTINSEIQKITEHGITIKSRHRLCQNTTIRLPNLKKIIPTISQEVVTMTVTNNELMSDKNTYHCELKFDSYDEQLLIEIRTWLIGAC